MTIEREFDLFWKFYGSKYAAAELLKEARQAFLTIFERQLALALKEE